MKHMHLSSFYLIRDWEDMPEPKNVLRFYLNDFILVLV